jgi:exonuclease-1
VKDMILKFRISKVIFVLDGAPLPAKNSTEEKRQKARKDALLQAVEFEKFGNSTSAHQYYARSVDVTPLMAHILIKVCK